MKIKLIITVLCGVSATLFAQEIADVTDPAAIKLDTPDRGVVVSGSLQDTIKNYPKLKEKLIAETAKKLETESEIAAVHRMQVLNGQKVDLPKVATDKHNARIAKFAKAKEDALNSVIKTTQVSVKIDSTMPQDIVDGYFKVLSDARALAQKAKAKQGELIAAGIPISKSTQDAVEKAQPRPTPTPALTPTPTPDGL